MAKIEALADRQHDRPAERVFAEALPVVIHNEGEQEALRVWRRRHGQLSLGDHLGLPEVGHLVFQVRHALEDAVVDPVGREHGHQAEQDRNICRAEVQGSTHGGGGPIRLQSREGLLMRMHGACRSRRGRRDCG